jgi:hypothetical protein
MFDADGGQFSVPIDIGCSKQRLMTIFNPILDVVELRQMKKYEPDDDLFGETFLWVGLFRKV